jgi:hypothetical protein
MRPRLESQHVFWYDRPQKADPARIPFAGSVSYDAQGTGGGGLIQKIGELFCTLLRATMRQGLRNSPPLEQAMLPSRDDINTTIHDMLKESL